MANLDGDNMTHTTPAEAQERDAAAPSWQPIATAPKETVFTEGAHSYGPTILVYAGEVLRARWWQHKDGSSNFIQDGGRACYPDHWMPLPAAPGAPQPPATQPQGDAYALAVRAQFIAKEFGAPLDSPETKAAHVAAIIALASSHAALIASQDSLIVAMTAQLKEASARLAAMAAPAPSHATQPQGEAQKVDLIARGMTWEQTEELMREACAQAGVQWDEEKEPQSLAINVMQRLANAAHKVGFKLGLERAALASSNAAAGQWGKPRFGVFLEDGSFKEVAPDSDEAQTMNPRWVGGPHYVQVIRAALQAHNEGTT